MSRLFALYGYLPRLEGSRGGGGAGRGCAAPGAALHENIDHGRTRTKSPRTNGIVERFHKTLLDAFHRIALRKRIYAAIDELQADLDAWLTEYNEVRTHQGRCCYGKTPMQTFLDAAPAARERQIGEQALGTMSA